MSWKIRKCQVCRQKTFVEDRNFSESELRKFVCHECRNSVDEKKELKRKLQKSDQGWARCSQCRRLLIIDPEDPEIKLCDSCRRIRQMESM